ncbi:glycosyltransferase [Dokdonella sp. MW10]|uniref:glycosyltransferase n=1 Tax=Dokdonella sp. MW10 TaxID=2992926 RepID=UPI003F7D9F19
MGPVDIVDRRKGRVAVIGVVIPAHNEQDLIAECLRSIHAAACAPALGGERVCIVVSLDRCTDATASIASACGAQTLSTHAGNVGLARAAGVDHVLAQGARWIAMTDADSRVPPEWLEQQLAYDADAFCGTVRVDDWLDYAASMPETFVGEHPVVDGHPHVHGANMGISAGMYRTCGGFPSVAVSEDVALITAVVRHGGVVARRVQPVVVTSARRDARAVGGFGDYLQKLELRLSSRETA